SRDTFAPRTGNTQTHKATCRSCFCTCSRAAWRSVTTSPHSSSTTRRPSTPSSSTCTKERREEISVLALAKGRPRWRGSRNPSAHTKCAGRGPGMATSRAATPSVPTRHHPILSAGTSHCHLLAGKLGLCDRAEHQRDARLRARTRTGRARGNTVGEPHRAGALRGGVAIETEKAVRAAAAGDLDVAVVFDRADAVGRWARAGP